MAKDLMLEMFKEDEKKKTEREKKFPGKKRKYAPLKSQVRKNSSGYFGISRNEV